MSCAARPLTGQLACANRIPSPCRGLWRSQVEKLSLSHTSYSRRPQKSPALGWPLRAQVAMRLNPFPKRQAARPLPVELRRGLCFSRKGKGSGSCPAPNREGQLELWPSAERRFGLHPRKSKLSFLLFEHLGPGPLQGEASLQISQLLLTSDSAELRILPSLAILPRSQCPP